MPQCLPVSHIESGKNKSKTTCFWPGFSLAESKSKRLRPNFMLLVLLVNANAAGILPKLAVVSVVCWGLGTNTNFDSTNITPALLWVVPPLAGSSPGPDQAPTALEVLSGKDAVLYKQIFAAQEHSDWKSADAAIADLEGPAPAWPACAGRPL